MIAGENHAPVERRATQALKREDQEYGNRMARILEDYPWNMSNRFEDPLEETALVLCKGPQQHDWDSPPYNADRVVEACEAGR